MIKSYVLELGAVATLVTMEIDPDYAVLNRTARQETSEYVLNQRAQQSSAVKKIRDVIEKQCNDEIESVESDVLEIDKRLNESRLLLDRLRASLLISYYDKSKSNHYSQSGNDKQEQPGIHPAIKTEIGKVSPSNRGGFEVASSRRKSAPVDKEMSENKLSHSTKPAENYNARQIKKKESQNLLCQKQTHRVIVGNVSKYLPVDSRQENDQVGVIYTVIFARYWAASCEVVGFGPGVRNSVTKSGLLATLSLGFSARF